jgi:hypothetical protein
MTNEKTGWAITLLIEDNEVELEFPENIIEYILNNFVHADDNEEIDDEDFYISPHLANFVH